MMSSSLPTSKCACVFDHIYVYITNYIIMIIVMIMKIMRIIIIVIMNIYIY